MNDHELIELLVGTDRYRPGTPLPELFGDHIAALHDIERRTQMESIERSERVPAQSGDDSGGPPKRSWRGAWLAAAAFVAVLAVVGAAAWIAGPDSSGVASDPPASTAAPTTTVSAEPTDAEAVAEAYFDAYQRGDLEEMRVLFASDILIRQGPGALTLGAWEMQANYFVAEEAGMADLRCVELSADGSTALVECSFIERNSLIDAVDADGVVVVTTLRISGSAIAQIDEQPDYEGYRLVAGPFEAWMDEFHPEDAYAVTCCAFFSVEEAQERGRLRRQYAEIWAAYIEENGCVWNEPCGP